MHIADNEMKCLNYFRPLLALFITLNQITHKAYLVCVLVSTNVDSVMCRLRINSAFGAASETTTDA
jgi:hypothetical protein